MIRTKPEQKNKNNKIRQKTKIIINKIDRNMTIFSCDFVFHLFGWCLVGSSHRKRIHRAHTDYDWKSTIFWRHDDDWNGTIQCKHLSHFVCARNFSIIPIWLLLRVHAWSTMTTTNGFFVVVVAVLRWLLLIVHIAIFGWCFAHRCCYIVLFHLFLVKNGWFMKKRRTSRPHKMPTHRTRWRINERTNSSHKHTETQKLVSISALRRCRLRSRQYPWQ